MGAGAGFRISGFGTGFGSRVSGLVEGSCSIAVRVAGAAPEPLPGTDAPLCDTLPHWLAAFRGKPMHLPIHMRRVTCG